MARRISTGRTGRALLGDLVTVDNNLRTLVLNEDLVLDPNGTGEVKVDANLQINAQNSLKLADQDSSNFIAFRAPTTVTSNYTLTFPATAGTTGYVLTTNGSGTLSWENVAVQVNNTIAADTAEYNITMTNATSGGITALNTVSTKITFKPSDGTLFLKNNTGSTSSTSGTLVVTGGVGISQNCYVGGTMSAVTITETSSIALKENISPITDALEKVLMLDGVNYTRKETGRYEAGLIAEAVEKIAPELVDNFGEHKSVQYTRLTAYLIEAVKHLKAELDALKSDK